jgi:arylsulfatase A-like enzyme
VGERGSLGRPALVGSIALVAALLGATASRYIGDEGRGPVPEPAAQLCALPDEWVELIRSGYNETRSGQIVLLPRTPMYMTTGSKGWTHSGPWDYLQEVPLVFYAPGLLPARGEIEAEPTLADVAPTLADALGVQLSEQDGELLTEVIDPIRAEKELDLRLILTIVWDGGGMNGLNRWPEAWPNLRDMMEEGISYVARVGSSPSVTPAVHTTLGTGVFPSTHGITDVPVRNDRGIVMDSFADGQSAGFIAVPTLSEAWDERVGGRAHIGMVGYEPWHLGMIGKGAETAGADHDDAVWVNRGSNHWVTKRDHYRIPAPFRDQSDLPERLDALDRADGNADDRWMRVPLDEDSRIEETPAFIAHHADKLAELVEDEGYGADRVTDLLYTNFKQIDRLAHYFNMASPEVEAAIASSDEQLGRLLDMLDEQVGAGHYMVILTADHGMQPDDDELDTFAIDPNEVERDLAIRFGPVIRSVWPTQAFVLEDALEESGATVEDIARFLADYRLRDNAVRPDQERLGAGPFDPRDRVFDLAVAADTLGEVTC